MSPSQSRGSFLSRCVTYGRLRSPRRRGERPLGSVARGATLNRVLTMRSLIHRFRRAAGVAPAVVSLLGLVGGVLAWLTGFADGAAVSWSVITGLALPLIVVSLINSLRQGRL